MPSNHQRKAQMRFRKQERLEARITREQKYIIERAARIRGTSVTNFVLASAQQAAVTTIQESETLKLREEAREVFVNALLNPPAPNAAARVAAHRYKKRMGL